MKTDKGHDNRSSVKRLAASLSCPIISFAPLYSNGRGSKSMVTDRSVEDLPSSRHHYGIHSSCT